MSENLVKIVYLGIGSNLGNRIINIGKAKSLLLESGINFVSVSNYYETPSWPDPKKPKFINIVLKGSEIKSIRGGKINIADSYAVEKNGEIILINSHIASYKQACYSNHSPMDERKLLLNKKEINKLIGKMQKDGFTLVPTKMYFKKGRAKIEIAVAKGKKQFDKRATKKNRDWNREKARHIRKSS